MECIYVPELEKNSKFLEVSGDEQKHLRALRINIKEKITITNGKGLSSIAKVISAGKNIYQLEIDEIYENKGELQVPFGLAIGILDNRERFEFAFEKAIELGITDFYPLLSSFTQKKHVDLNRLKAKAIAAIKQSQRSCLPIIHEPETIKDFLKDIQSYSNIILTDIEGKENINISKESTIVIVGPEGGFTKEEILIFENDNRTQLMKLVSRRLRAETAAAMSLGIISKMLE